MRHSGSFSLAESHRTLAETLRDAGYQTAAVTGAFVLNGRYGLTQGFETYWDVMPPRSGSRGSVSPAYPEISAEEVTDRALQLLGRLSPSRPFFLWVHYFDPHAAYRAPDRFARKYPGDAYAAEVAYVDEQLNRIFADLKSRGLWKTTSVLVTSDHGESLGEHGEADHGHLLHEATVRVSTLLKLPGAPRGLRYDVPIRSVDLMPTVLEALGVEGPAEMQGRSVRWVWEGVSRHPLPAYCETYLTYYDYGWAYLRSLTRDGWKLIVGSEAELYDLGRDPGEVQNLVGDKPERAVLLRKTLAGLEKRASRSIDSRKRSSSEEAAALRSLGYLGGSTPEAPDAGQVNLAELPAPRDVLHLQEKIWQAWQMQGQDKTGEALELLEQVLEENPGNTSALRFAAALALESGEWERAELLLRRLGAAWPSEAWRGEYLAAYRLWASGKIDQAAERYLSLLSGCPDVDVAELDRCLDSLQDFVSLRLAEADRAGARSALSRYGGFDAGSLAAADRIRLARLQKQAGLMQEAERALRRLVDQQSELPEARFALANLYRETGRSRAAIEAFERTLELDERFVPALINLAALHGSAGDDARAGELLRRAVELEPEHAGAWANLGLSLSLQGETQAARSALERAIELDSEGLAARLNLARIYIGQGLSDRARELLAEVLDLDPENEEAQEMSRTLNR